MTTIEVETEESGVETWEVSWYCYTSNYDLYIHLPDGTEKLFLLDKVISVRVIPNNEN